MSEYKDSEYDCGNCDVLDAFCRRLAKQSGKKRVRIIELRQRAEAAEAECAKLRADNEWPEAMRDEDAMRQEVDDGRREMSVSDLRG